ncbi:hypothetical protein M885DRAFT_518323 [Pelagophyceae sp. CCMP2097]|nr:hypothetical protein M885DRAFT_518323 [Pelagophyceae sp. CCMP2097]
MAPYPPENMPSVHLGFGLLAGFWPDGNLVDPSRRSERPFQSLQSKRPARRRGQDRSCRMAERRKKRPPGARLKGASAHIVGAVFQTTGPVLNHLALLAVKRGRPRASSDKDAVPIVKRVRQGPWRRSKGRSSSQRSKRSISKHLQGGLADLLQAASFAQRVTFLKSFRADKALRSHHRV